MFQEFFCGIGGMHYGIERLILEFCPETDKQEIRSKLTNLITSFDINPNTNQTYQFNFNKKVIEKQVQNCDLKRGIWLMSPPCQPFTRTGKQLDVEDERCQGFLFLVKNIKEYKPWMIFIENVIGFEYSQARQLIISELQGNGYSWKEYVISPLQLGIPNDRPRYYLCAQLDGYKEYFFDVLAHVGITATVGTSKKVHKLQDVAMPKGLDPLKIPREKPVIELTREQQELGFINDLGLEYHPQPIYSFLDNTRQLSIQSNVVDSLLPLKLYKSRFGFDPSSICQPFAFTSPCFTKAYGKHSVYSGGFLQTRNTHIYFDSTNVDDRLLQSPGEAVETLGLALFSAEEIKRLQGFWDVEFPNGITELLKYKMLGNSMSVDVVHHVMKHAWFSLEE